MAAKKLLLSLSIAALGCTAAAGMGFYVYPDRPFIVWTLLFLCWACFRLHRRAQTLFANRQRQPAHVMERLAPYTDDKSPAPPSDNS